MSPVDYHAWTHLPKAKGGTDPLPFGLPFAWASTGVVEVDDLGGTGVQVADFGTASNFQTNDANFFQGGIYEDTGNTPEFGIYVPANCLVQVYTSLALLNNVADGWHNVGYIIDGDYSPVHVGPARASEFTSSASSVIGLADDKTAPEGLFHVDHAYDNEFWVVGVVHEWAGWTTGPLNFQYEITVLVLGDLLA